MTMASDSARARPIPKGIVARAIEGVRYAITGVTRKAGSGRCSR